MLACYREMIMMKNSFDKQNFIHNLNLMVNYGWEPEIDLECKDGKVRGIVAYRDWIDVYDENYNHIKKIKETDELFDIIPAETIISAIDDFGLDYSEDLSDTLIIEDGELHIKV